MAERIMVFTVALLLMNSLYANDQETKSVDMGLIEFLGEGKKVDGEWVDPLMLGDQQKAGSEEQNHE